ncbi:MAG: hypothetical protein JSS66_15600 [Armatimonadetes bacterium]|nr:hypothetical protein [Armatimonadota bacterium]
MIMTPLALLVGLSMQAAASQDAVTVLGKPTAIEFPSGGPFTAQSAQITVGDTKVAVGPDGSLVQPFKVDGGWGDLKAAYEASKAVGNKRPYRVKAIVFDAVTEVETSALGVVRQKRGLIQDEDMDRVRSSLALLKAMIEGASGGVYDVKLDAELDEDPVVFESATNGVLPMIPGRLTLNTPIADAGFWAGFLKDEVAPRVNDEKFDTDDGVYRGPYDAVFVIHAGLDGASGTTMVDRTPMSLVPCFSRSPWAGNAGLATGLFEAWKRQILASVSGGTSPSGAVAPEFPTPVSGSAWSALIERADRGKTAGSSPLATIPVESAASLTGATAVGEGGRMFVRAELIDVVSDRMAGTKPTWDAWAVSASGAYLRLGQGVSADAVRASLDASPARGAAAPAPSLGQAVGSFECQIPSKEGDPVQFDMKQRGTAARGYVVIATGPLTPAGLSFSCKSSIDENWAVVFWDAAGKPIGQVFLEGDTPMPDEGAATPSVLAACPADDQWHDVTVSLQGVVSGPVSLVTVQAPVGNAYERQARGPASLSLKGLKWDAVSSPTPVPDSRRKVAALARVNAQSPDDQKADLMAALKSSDTTTKLTAINVLTKVKMPDSVPALIDLMRTTSASVTLLATRAVAFQDLPTGLAELRNVVERGPFDHNRRFAAVALAPRNDPAMAASFNFMAYKSWHARLESVRALSNIKSTSSNIIMAAMLLSEPVAAVRLEIARRADPSIELVARRLNYTAVNDPSQWVRAVSYGRLIDSQDKNVLTEALKGVRDDAVGVRLYLLEEMRTRAKESYRPALRIAVVDPNPNVRAAALRAFATQPGPVEADEVRNTFTDQDPAVKAALAELVRAKNIKVPAS